MAEEEEEGRGYEEEEEEEVSGFLSCTSGRSLSRGDVAVPEEGEGGRLQLAFLSWCFFLLVINLCVHDCLFCFNVFFFIIVLLFFRENSCRVLKMYNFILYVLFLSFCSLFLDRQAG